MSTSTHWKLRGLWVRDFPPQHVFKKEKKWEEKSSDAWVVLQFNFKAVKKLCEWFSYGIENSENKGNDNIYCAELNR